MKRANRLETLEDLAAAVRRLEGRLDALESGQARGAGEAPAAPSPPDRGGDGTLLPAEALRLGFWTSLSLAGRTLLALGGAFLLRAGTDRGTLPLGAGVLAGIAYSVLWIALAYRDEGRERHASAGFHGAASILIGYPLIWEATTRFGFFSPAAAAGALASLTAVALFAVWRRAAAFLAGAFSLAAAFLALALSFATGSMALYAGLLTGLAVAVLWLSYSRGWVGARWLVAAAANVAVARAVLAGSAPGGAAGGPAPDVAQGLAFLLLVVFLGSFALRTLWKRCDVGPFEILQSLVVLLLGLGGATRVANTAGSDVRLLGAGVLAAAVASYLVAFVFVRRRDGRGRNFFFYGTLALLLALVGAVLAGGSGVRTVTWGLLAVTGAFLGGRFDRVSLRAHCGIYGFAAAVSGGLFATAAGAMLGSAEVWRTHPWAPVAMACALASYGILVGTRSRRKAPRLARLPRLVLAGVSVAGVVAYLVILVAAVVLRQGVEAGPAGFAAGRTFVLSATAVLLAWVHRRTRIAELGWVTWALLAGGGAKLLLQDLTGGGAASLFVAFAFYGAALILVPRLLRPGRAATAA